MRRSFAKTFSEGRLVRHNRKSRRFTSERAVATLLSLALPALSLRPAQAQSQRKLDAAFQLGEQADISDNFVAAEQQYLRALSIAREFGPQSNQVVQALLKVAEAQVMQEKFASADATYHQALKVFSILRASGKYDPEDLVCFDDLADAYSTVEEKSPLLSIRQRVVEIRQMISPSHPKLDGACRDLGLRYFTLGRAKEAAQAFKQCIAVLDANNRGNTTVAGMAHFFLQNCCMQLGQYKEAEREGDKALPLLDNQKSVPQSTITPLKLNQAIALAHDGKFKEAEQRIKDLRNQHEKLYRGQSAFIADDDNALAEVCLLKGDQTRALQLSTRAVELLDAQKNKIPGHGPAYTDSLRRICLILNKQNQKSKAAHWQAKLQQFEKTMHAQHTLRW